MDFKTRTKVVKEPDGILLLFIYRTKKIVAISLVLPLVAINSHQNT